MTSHPDQGFPLYYVENKRQEQIFWARYVDVGVAFFGVHIYALASIIHGNLAAESSSKLWWLITQSVLSPLLMAPYLHQRRMKAWKQDALMISTEFEALWKYWQWMGSSAKRKVYSFLFLSAIVILFLCCGVLSTIMAMVMAYAILAWVDVDAPIQRETLEAFQRRATTVAATVVWCKQQPTRRSILGIIRRYTYFVRIQYIAPSSGEHVVKDIRSKLLYEDLTRHGNIDSSSSSIEILVDPEYPLSGYPSLQFIWDLHHSWSLCTWHICCFVAIWFYFCTAALALDIDLDDPPEESAVSFGIIFITPMLLLPHASVLRRREYNQSLLDLYEKGSVVEMAPGKNVCFSNRSVADRDDEPFRAEDSYSGSSSSGSESYESNNEAV
ncbi:MAG: hypothetical protein SGARI_003572 [Bacillariaceae sp.]